MTPRLLHDAWLVLTVVTIVEAFAIALYLWKMSGGSGAQKFLRALAIVLFSVVVEQSTAELKNFYQQEPPVVELGIVWLAGRAQQAIVGALVLGYLIFGKNGTKES